MAHSETTANLIIHMLSVDKEWVRPLPMDIPVVIPNTGGVKVTLIDANHCMLRLRTLLPSSYCFHRSWIVSLPFRGPSDNQRG